MEEVIEALQQASQNTSFVLEAANEDDVLRAQDAILLPIPYDFREFLLTVSHLSIGHLEPVSVSDTQVHTYLPELTAIAWNQGVPRDVIVLCEHVNGYYCVSSDGQVGLWVDGDFIEDCQWASVWDWAQEVWLA